MQVALLLLPAIAFQGGAKVQIKDLKVGTGPAAQAGDYLAVDYTGKLTNGQVFDTSKGGQPFKLVLGAGSVIEGWEQGLRGMKVGGKRQITIPPALGYGARGAGEIPPNATLKFDVELRKLDRIKVEILRPGKGPAAAGRDTVHVHYKGTFTSGKKFDSSYDHGQPMPVTIGQSEMIPGFMMALIGLKKGEKRKVMIPPQLAYGKEGAGGVIPPNATLVFEIEAMTLNKSKR